MILEHNGKRLAFGLNWKSRFSEGDVHADARNAKSKFFWHGDKAVYIGMLPEGEVKKKQKSPLYAGVIALLQRYPDIPNLIVVLAIPESEAEFPDGAFVVCGIHQSRPHSAFDKIVSSKDEVLELLISFKELCGGHGFGLYGDVKLSGITPATFDDLHKGADQNALMRKTKSALVNPLVSGAAGIIVISAVIFGYNTYSKHQRAEAKRIAKSAQKNSQQLYEEELNIRRQDPIVLAANVHTILAPLREMTFSLGGWSMKKATCNLVPEKQMVCAFDYQREEGSPATYETFLGSSKQQFSAVEFSGRTIKAVKIFAGLPFTKQGEAIDAAKTQRDSIIEFGSTLQRLERFGKHKRDEFQPFAIVPGMNAAELTRPAISTAAWEFTTPFRNTKELAALPSYITVTQLDITYTDKPSYDLDTSLAMVKIAGNVVAKP
jgi:hypothetical protein